MFTDVPVLGLVFATYIGEFCASLGVRYCHARQRWFWLDADRFIGDGTRIELVSAVAHLAKRQDGVSSSPVPGMCRGEPRKRGWQAMQVIDQ
jgi:hypothetical protein